jgi:uncharacterized protein involved in exopolysaccharide biosynthesis
MQDLLNSKSNDEIDLKEVFIILWAYKLFIASTCVFGILLAGYYSLNADKKYTSEAIFKLNQASPKGLQIGGSLASMSNFAGLALPATKNLSIDQIMGRIFIEKLDKKLNFKGDPYFNTYNQNLVEPIWKSIIKRAIGLERTPANVQEAIWQNILAKYSKNVFLEETTDGPIKIQVTHTIPQRAAEIANTIMDTIISNEKDKKNRTQDQIVYYMSNSLAEALSDLEISQNKLKEFALKNSVGPLEIFTAGSLKLDTLREQLSRASELHEAVYALSLILQNKSTDQNSYLILQQQFPIVDQVEFRRVLGQSEIISSWTWPEANLVDAVLETLYERKSRLVSKINVSQIEAEQSGITLENYNKLMRNSKVAEATYTVLIEQVKSQNTLSGFQPDNTEIYEYASTSIIPTSPNRNLLLILGALLGLFLGATISLMYAFRRGVYYSKEALIIGAQAQLTGSIKSIILFRNKSLEYISTMLVKKSYPILREMAVEIHKNDTTQVVVSSSHAKLKGNDVARALASYMQSESIKIAVIDFSSKVKRPDIHKEILSIGSFNVVESAGNISVLSPDDDISAMELLSQKEFNKNKQFLISNFDLLFLCADNDDAISLLRALEGQKTFHISLVRTKKTKSANIYFMRRLIPIQGLLHD